MTVSATEATNAPVGALRLALLALAFTMALLPIRASVVLFNTETLNAIPLIVAEKEPTFVESADAT